MNCNVRFYDAKRAELFGKKLTLTDKLIFARSRPLVHVEFQFSERYAHISFSATMRDGLDGCRFKAIDYTVNPQRWATLVLPLTDEQEDKAYLKAKQIEKYPYDLFGLLSFISDLDVIKPDKYKYWCSEAVQELINAGFESTILFPEHTTPTGMFFDLSYWMGII